MAFFVVQCIYAPFMDPVNNAQEWTSRLNYVATSLTGLLVVLNIPGGQILDTYVLYAYVSLHHIDLPGNKPLQDLWNYL